MKGTNVCPWACPLIGLIHVRPNRCRGDDKQSAGKERNAEEKLSLPLLGQDI